MKTSFSALFLWSLLLMAGGARAGSVISTNLPAGSSIVNIDAQQDGAASYNGDQSLWYSPFSTQGAASLLELPVSAGTYSFSIIDPADAAAAFPSLTQAQRGSIFTAWTYNSPWITDYFVFDLSAATDSSQPQLFDGAPDPTSFGDAQSAYNDAKTTGFANKIRTGPLGRDGTTYATTYTIAAPTTLVFVVPDYYLPDNNGGVSVLVTPVPEPSTAPLVLAGTGLALAAGWRQRMFKGV